MKKHFKPKKKNIAILAGIAAAAVVILFISYEEKKPIDYEEHSSDTAVTVDGEVMTLSDVAYYVLYEEKTIEEQAEVYNPENTKDYWNLHVDGMFISDEAKNTAIGMAIHDRIFYNAAKKRGMKLSQAEKTALKNSIQDFWMDLLDEQQKNIPTTDEEINQTIEEMALAQKYQTWIAKKHNRTYHEYDWDGYDYKQLLEKSHTVKINRRIWNRVRMGEISVHHTRVNYINGYTKDK